MDFVKAMLFFTAPSENLLVFPVFRQILVKFDTYVHFGFRSKVRVNELHNMLASITEFRENWRS